MSSGGAAPSACRCRAISRCGSTASPNGAGACSSRVALLGLVVAVLAQFPVVVGPIVVAVTLAATFLPAVASLERRGWTRGRASLVVSVVVWVAVSVVTVLSVTALGASVQEAIARRDQRGAGGGRSLAGRGVGSHQRGVRGAGQRASSRPLASVASSIALALGFLVVTALLAYFMLRDGDRGLDLGHLASRWLAPQRDRAGR